MVIPISVSTKDYIKVYISLLNPVMKLRNREKEVLYGIVITFLNLYKECIAGRMTEEEVDKRIDDPMGRKVIADYIHMSRQSFNNHYSALKKKGILKNNKLPEYLKVKKPELLISYKITLN